MKKNQLLSIRPKTGEYFPANKQPRPVVIPPKRGFFRGILSSFIVAVITVVTIFLVLMFGRQWYDSLLVRIDHNKVVHPDKSVAKSGVSSQVPPQITLVYKNQAGKSGRVIANARDYSAFVNQEVANLENAKILLLAQTQPQLHEALSQVFEEMQKRIDRFADWYFAYPTTYKILWTATTATAHHALSVEAISLSDAVAYEVETYLHQHYAEIVLRPEITDPQLQTVFKAALQTAHQRYLTVLSETQANFQAFVENSTTHLKTLEASKIELVLDWQSQFNKVNLAKTEYEKGAEGAALSAALMGGGAVVGKSIAGIAGKSAAGKVVASKAVASAASKGIFSKLASPFVSKAVLASSGGAVGTAGGPVGTVLGAATGLGIDYAINEGLALAQRDKFIADVSEALRMTQTEYETAMWQALQETINIWMTDTMQLLPRYQK
jgi:hypothetical protein